MSVNLEDTQGEFIKRRIRHIGAIQVRNLTPFPLRDTFASALSQPSEQPQFGSHGHLADDLDVTLSRKRARRISASSLYTLRSFKSEDGASEEFAHGVSSAELMGRRRTASRASLPASKGSAGTSGVSSTASATVRASHRTRTSSMGSSMNISIPPVQATPSSSSTSGFMPLSAMLPDNSQQGLEKVIKPRLVETFIAISVPSLVEPKPLPRQTTSTPGRLNTPSSRPLAANPKPNGVASPVARKGVKPSPLTTPEQTASTSRRDSIGSPRLVKTAAKMGHTKSASTSALRPNGKTASASSPIASPTPPATPPPRTDTPPIPLPSYLSQTHRPSTNPYFPLNRFEFAEDTDFSAHKLQVEIWGNVDGSWRGQEVPHANGKGKEREHHDTNAALEWSVLDEWDVDLDDLIPLSPDLAARPSHLPSNSLLITLTPPGEIFYLPRGHPLPSPPPTPSGGYNSDPETEVRRVSSSRTTEGRDATKDGQPPLDIVALSRRRVRRGRGSRSENAGDLPKTAGWQDLFNLVTRQSHILDNQTSLANVVRQIDKILEKDVITPLKRGASRRQAFVEELLADEEGVRARSLQLRDEIAARRVEIRRRREMLAMAKEQEKSQVCLVHEHEPEVAESRKRLATLRSRITPTRTTLLTTLSTIYPIDLYSPPDLLFTILDVPLPIPLSATDPGPPLFLPAHKDVTEDAVATSLGYAAQVVYFMAIYMGKVLVYPITCIGSRSLIKDGISAMVGPRMFPLFSKGVDTYRFEYAVFLLNKNIEMLMADRELRALDMRHTLPNLKNLLLTLTDGDSLKPQRSIKPAQMPMSELESPRSETEPLLVRSESSTSVSSRTDDDAAATPKPDEHSKKTSSFLGFGFLRAARPTWGSSIKAASVETSLHESSDTTQPASDDHPPVETADIDADDEDGDRHTIRGGEDAITPTATTLNGVGDAGGKPHLTGNNGNGSDTHSLVEKSLALVTSSTAVGLKS